MQCKLRHLGSAKPVAAHLSDATLRELAAHGASIVTLHVPRVTTVASVARTLRKLDVRRASTRDLACGIDDAGLALATRITVLDASYNVKIHTVAPFASTLRKLDASFDCGIGDVGLAAATCIEELDASCNDKIRTIAPFASTLRALSADGDCGIDDAALAAATRILDLSAEENPRIRRGCPRTAQTISRHAQVVGRDFPVQPHNHPIRLCPFVFSDIGTSLRCDRDQRFPL